MRLNCLWWGMRICLFASYFKSKLSDGDIYVGNILPYIVHRLPNIPDHQRMIEHKSHQLDVIYLHQYQHKLTLSDSGLSCPGSTAPSYNNIDGYSAHLTPRYQEWIFQHSLTHTLTTFSSYFTARSPLSIIRQCSRQGVLLIDWLMGWCGHDVCMVVRPAGTVCYTIRWL